jgi:hypothetical protein
MEEQLINLISNVGFPIAITIYLLVFQNKVIQENTNATKELINFLREKK